MDLARDLALELLRQVPGDGLTLPVLTSFSLAGLISYSSWKPFSMSTPSFFGRSRMWPTEAMTLYPLPRYLVMVFALEGFSTITSLVTRFSLGGYAA